MKFREIFRFELGYQLRTVSTWIYAAVLLAFAVLLVRFVYIGEARSGEHFLNAPVVVIGITVFGGIIWLMMAAAVAGDAAARDVHTGMHPLVYTAPVSKAEYLGGRFLAAFVLNAAILLALPAGMLLAWLAPGVEPELLGPFRPAALLAAYGVLALPFAFFATAIQFAAATWDRRMVASYLASVALLIAGQFISGAVAQYYGEWDLAKLLDPLGIMGIIRFLDEWTLAERNTRLLPEEGWLLANRLLWLAIATGALALTYVRFRFAHHTDRTRFVSLRSFMAGLKSSPALRTGLRSVRRARQPVRRAGLLLSPAVANRQSFGFATHARQTRALAWTSFRLIAKSRTGLTLVAVVALPIVALSRDFLRQVGGIATIPTTARILDLMTARLTDLRTPWIVIPLLIVYYAGELVWREREAGMGEIGDAAPVPEWVLFLGKLLGLGLAIAAWMAILTVAGMVVQLDAGYRHFEIGLYLRTLFGLQLTEYLLFASLVLLVHVLANQKYVGYLAALGAYGFIGFASRLGLDHDLLVYSSAPAWSYTNMSGFGTSLGPWLWLKSYWAAWALLLAVAARLLWPRGRDHALHMRLRLARARFTPPTARVAAAAAALILVLGGFIFYNTNVLNAYRSPSALMERSAEYERRYGKYERIPQPRLEGTRLHVEIYPQRQTLEIRGTYTLVNRDAAAIDTIHLAPATEAETGAVTFDGPAALTTADEDLGHRIYALEKPLQPGESLLLSFEVRHAPRGFRNSGAPGALRRTWTQSGRRYFHYSTDAPILNVYRIFSAKYALHEAQWRNVSIRLYHHPAHAANVERMVRGVRAALDYCTAQFGPYPFNHLTIVERATQGGSLHAEATAIDYGERFALFKPQDGPQALDIVFFALAHEVAHQWWGPGLPLASVEGAPFLAEGLANYTAMQVLEKTYGHAHLQRYLSQVLRRSYEVPRSRAAVPLLRADSAFLAYRKGAHVMYALSRYLGDEQVNGALRRMFEKHTPESAALVTTLDLYRELQAVTPDSLQSLLHDLFEANTFWELATERATALQTAAGTWEVTLDVRARKVVVDEAGAETVVPTNDWIEIGIFDGNGELMYLQRHHITASAQTITVTVPRPAYAEGSGGVSPKLREGGKPAHAGIDPSYLLIDWETDDNIKTVRDKK